MKKLSFLKSLKNENKIYRQLIVHFLTYNDMVCFIKITKQIINSKTTDLFYKENQNKSVGIPKERKIKQIKQTKFLNIKPQWEKEWREMPEYKTKQIKKYKSIKINFKTKKDFQKFSKDINQKITEKTKYIYYFKNKERKKEKEIDIKERYGQQNKKEKYDINPKYPIYIISKNRWESRLTVKALEKINVPFRIVIEPQEYKQYASVIDRKKILTLPFSNLGKGSIPARNWVWEHSISENHKYHWILDDNISVFFRLNRNKRIRVSSGAIFRAAEDFVERYKNVSKAGFQYKFFAIPTEYRPPYYLNHRIYSCILLKNNTNYRWRGRYNEDTDLSIRMLKDGYCTILFNAFLCEKAATMTMKGGNTDILYIQDKNFDGRLEMAKSLQKQHPDIVKITKKWGRWQHQVNYSKFKKNKLEKKDNIKILNKINNYGMIYEKLINNKWVKQIIGE